MQGWILNDTCYLNAVLFSLCSIPVVRGWLREHQKLALLDRNHAGSCILCLLWKDVSRLLDPGQAGAFTPVIAEKRMLLCGRFAGDRHQDVDEVFDILRRRKDNTSKQDYGLPFIQAC